MPKVIQVIQSEECEGKGTSGNPNRTVIFYHTLDGKYLARYDRLEEEEGRA